MLISKKENKYGQAVKILILGGYGNAGFLIAKLLLQESNALLVIAGRNLKRAQHAADKLNREFHTDRVLSRKANAADMNSLAAAFEGVQIVVVASSTINYTSNIAESALNVDADYLDIQLSSPQKLTLLNSLRDRIESKGRCFITDGGFHPGVPAALVRYAAAEFDTLETANISSAFQLDWKKLQFSESTTTEFIDELKEFNPLIFKNKKWHKLSMKEFPKLDFGERFGKRFCSPMFLEELRSLPNTIPSLNETAFYIAGFNWMTDFIIIPIVLAAVKIFRDKSSRSVEKIFSWGLRNFSKPPFGAVLQLEARGLKNKKKILYEYETYS